MKAYWRKGITAPRILDLDTVLRFVVSYIPRPLYPEGNNLWYPLDRKLGGSQSRSGNNSEGKNSQHLPGLEPPIIQPVTHSILLSHPGFLFRRPYRCFFCWNLTLGQSFAVFKQWKL
jgi:hypothetical protein